MNFCIPHPGLWLAGCFILCIFTTYAMMKQAAKFFSGKRRKKFSMLELQFPSSPAELSSVLSGIDDVPQLPPPGPVEIKKAVRSQLLVDFLFMPAAYGGIFLLCMISAHRIGGGLQYFFIFAGWLQLVAWIFDIIENIFLLNKIRKPTPPGDVTFNTYQWLEGFKWGISLISLFLALGALGYCWLMGFSIQQPLHF